MLMRFYRRLGKREECFYIDLAVNEITTRSLTTINWILSDVSKGTYRDTRLHGDVTEVGPRVSMMTPFSSNAVSLFERAGIPATRIERSVRYPASMAGAVSFDPMTQEVYPTPLTSFDIGVTPEPVQWIRFREEGMPAFIAAKKALGLGMDVVDMEYYFDFFVRVLKRNPSDVELFQIDNMNSDHSRHHLFRGVWVIDGMEMPLSLIDLIKAPWKANSSNTLAAFNDNSGVIKGCMVPTLLRRKSWRSSRYYVTNVLLHITITAETHNHPTLISPFEGAATGVGGRQRDNMAVGRGGFSRVGFAGYAVGNLHIPGYEIPGEEIGGEEVPTHASPLRILIEASNGASDYGNKEGEPLIGGFTRAFGQYIDGKRMEFCKPILFTAGIGRVFDEHVQKHEPKIGMCIVHIGGLPLRLGVGGGSASSMMPGESSTERDFASVQRGDPEMANRVHRVLDACVQMRDKNPIQSLHDQGAGGLSNVLSELMEPIGGQIDLCQIALGDKTMSTREIWSAEFQEGYGLLMWPKNLELLRRICRRERVPRTVFGRITGTGNVVVKDSRLGTIPVKLSLQQILGDVPRKRYESKRIPFNAPSFIVPDGHTFGMLVQRVFKRIDVGSKRFLTTKVDRSVTGLVAQQQLCGPKQIPVSDVGVTADGYFSLTGAATAVGEQPIVMLIDPVAGAQMSVAELVTNIAAAKITGLRNIGCRVNWMWPAKLAGEGARLYDAAVAASELLTTLGIAPNGGKDSSSMAAKVNGELAISPGQLVITGCAHVPDITKTVTPDFKGDGVVMMIDMGKGKNRLGGSSLAQSFGVTGNDPPRIDDPQLLIRAFDAVQELIERGLITAYHDRSGGGLIATLAEMCLAGNCGLTVGVRADVDAIPTLFNEEAGMIFECSRTALLDVQEVLDRFQIKPQCLGVTQSDTLALHLFQGDEVVFHESLATVRVWWEATATAIEMRQANPEMVRQEVESFADTRIPKYHLPFIPKLPKRRKRKPPLAVLREEGINGDAEMVAMYEYVGFSVTDVATSDLLTGDVDSLDRFQKAVAPGGFSFADVFGSGKGEAATIRETPRLWEMFKRFRDREDTLMTGICNGCQLMTYLDLVPWSGIAERSQPRLIHNKSRRFESRWPTLKVPPNPAVVMRGMEGSIIPIHVAHGEGQWHFPDSRIAEDVISQQLVPLVYVGLDGEPTEQYPHNPNGSPNGIAALCSMDGRFFAAMPHPERCFQKWQWPWMPTEWRTSLAASPWLQMAINARDWCLEHH